MSERIEKRGLFRGRAMTALRECSWEVDDGGWTGTTGELEKRIEDKKNSHTY
jgi:hypothetical protein